MFGFASAAASSHNNGRGIWRFRIAAVASASLVALALCEIPAVFGWLDYRTVLATDGISTLYNPRYRLDRELIGIHVPHERFTGEVPGDLVERLDIDTDRRYEVDVVWDGNGFRNGDPGDPQIEAADVIVLGDSYAEAVLVPFDKTFVALLRTRRAGDNGHRVLSLAHGGYGPQQEWAAMRRFGFAAKPKTVVWMFYEGNDLANAAAYDAIQADWDGWVSREHGFLKRSLVRNAIVKLADWSTSPRHNPAVSASRAATLRVPGEHGGETMYFGYRAEPLTRAEQATLAKTQKLWLTAADELRSQGIRLVLVFVPTKWRVYRSLVEPGEDSKLGQWLVSDLNEAIGRWAAANKLEFLDLTPSLTDTAAGGELVYFLDDAHWTSAGHAVVAEALRSKLAGSRR